MTDKGAEEPRKRLYFDTSAYLAVLLKEAGSDRLATESASAVLLSSVLLVLESKRNLVRLTREGTLTPEQYATCIDRLEQDIALFELRDLTLDLCRTITVPPVTTPRSLDLGHLQTALWFHAADKIDRFVTMDDSQKHAAEELGLPV